MGAGYGGGFALIVVLFILLIIVGANFGCKPSLGIESVCWALCRKSKGGF